MPRQMLRIGEGVSHRPGRIVGAPRISPTVVSPDGVNVKLGKNAPQLKFGRYPNDPSRARIVLHPDGAITPPASANWVSGNFPIAELGMLGNDQWGDCVFAGGYHAV